MLALPPERIAQNINAFSGRAWLLEKILNWYDQSGERLMLINGKPGTGKSMISAWLAGYGPPPPAAGDQARLDRLRNLIRATHFCKANSMDNSPKGMADNVARQLVAGLKNFDKALIGQMGKNVNLEIHQDAKEVYGTMTGMIVKELNLGDLLDEPSFQVALLQPLQLYYNANPSQAILLVIDSFDEAMLYGGKYKILHAVESLLDLPAPVRVLGTVRDPSDLPRALQSALRVDLINDAPPGVQDVAEYVRARLSPAANPALARLGQAIVDRAQGNFLFAHLVLEDLLKRQAGGEQPKIEDVPHGLAEHYEGFLRRLSGDDSQVWRKELRPVVGLVAVAQDPGLKLGPLGKISQRKPGAILDILLPCRAYLNGEFNEHALVESGPFTLFHKSFADFLLDTQGNLKYYVDPCESHTSVANYYWPTAETLPDWQEWDTYGLRHMPTHLAGASCTIDEDARHSQTERLVRLVMNPSFQQDFIQRIKDLAQLEHGLDQALDRACADTSAGAMELIISAVHNLIAFRQTVRQPRQIFRLAARGELDAAGLSLRNFAPEEHWRMAAELLIAWIGTAVGAPSARQAFEAVEKSMAQLDPLPRLCARIKVAWGGLPPEPGRLPPPPPPNILEALVFRLKSDKVRSGLIAYVSEAEYDVQPKVYEGLESPQGPDGAPVELARVEGPALVSYVRAHEGESAGSRAFLRYVNIMASNQYLQYRNLALWEMLDAALLHPDDRWARQALVRVISAALAPGGAEFTEALGIVLAGQKARLQGKDGRTYLETRLTYARNRASMLGEDRGFNDVTGAHKRRFTALALAYRLLPGEKNQVEDLLRQAYYLPRGYAGFMVPAWLNLAETIRITGYEPIPLAYALEQAEIAAHHIQNAGFCARTTARVRAIRHRWWDLPADQDLESLITNFVGNPFAVEFAPIHRIGEQYNYRTVTDAKDELPQTLRGARSLGQISWVMGFKPGALVKLNHKRGWDERGDLPTDADVSLPDPGFAPWLAARLAAEVAVRPFPSRRKQALIQSLVPVAVSDRTALDTILARLVYAAAPGDLEIVRASEIAMGGPAKTPVDADKSRSVTGAQIGVIGR